jgi:hypothetical protein
LVGNSFQRSVFCRAPIEPLPNELLRCHQLVRPYCEMVVEYELNYMKR